MSWDFFPLNVATLPAKGLQEPAIWLELQTAINERAGVVGIPTIGFCGSAQDEPLFRVDGEVIPGKLGIGDVQDHVRGIAGCFLNHQDNGGNWDGLAATAFPPLYTWGSGTHNICDAAYANVGNGTNWTRKLGTAPDGIVTQYGKMQVGDYAGIYKQAETVKIAEWLNEMYRVLDLCRWTPIPTFFDDGSGNGIGRTRDDGNSNAGWAAAWANLIANWSPSWSTGYGEIRYASHDAVFQAVGWPAPFGAYGQNRRGYLVGPVYAGGLHYDVDFYAKGADPATWEGWGSVEWDDDGLGYEQSKLKLIETKADCSGSWASSTAMLGNDETLQDKPDEPLDEYPVLPTYRGWIMHGLHSWSSWLTVLLMTPGPWYGGSWTETGWTLPGTGGMQGRPSVAKWDVSNGFTKVT